MRKLLRFCNIANFVTIAMMSIVREALFPSLSFSGGGDNLVAGAWRSLFGFALVVLYDLIIITCCHRTWRKVQSCYLDVNGRKLRDADVFARKNFALYIGAGVVTIALSIAKASAVIDGRAFFWIGIVPLLINIGSLLVLVGYVAFVRLGHRFGKVAYCDPVRVGTSHVVYDVFSGTETVIYEWLPIPEE